MATFYSSFFSSGLLAPRPPRTPEGTSPMTTPRARHASLAPDTMQVDSDTTPTSIGDVKTADSTTSSDVFPTITIGGSQSRVRRRRSSITLSTSPVAALKSSAMRSATSSIQRQSLLSTRARAGSDASILSTSSTGSDHRYRPPPAPATQANSLLGRLRSGSLSTAMRSRRVVLRRNAPPPPPPPMAPLPALPLPPVLSGDVSAPTTPRRPHSHRSYTADTPPSFNLLMATADDDGWNVAPALPSSPGYGPSPSDH